MRLVPAYTLAQQYGVKLLVYGPPGTAKTPICGTAPSPVLLAVETGKRSLTGQRFMAHETRSPAEILGFFDWFCQSREARQYHTLCVDSMSEVGDVILQQCLSETKDGRKAYGKLADMLKPRITALCNLKEAHLYLIAKLDIKTLDDSAKRWPMMPGNVLSNFLPHETDECYYVDRMLIPGGPPTPVLCWQTFTDSITHARSRAISPETMRPIVNGYEECNLSNLFAKITGRK